MTNRLADIHTNVHSLSLFLSQQSLGKGINKGATPSPLPWCLFLRTSPLPPHDTCFTWLQCYRQHCFNKKTWCCTLSLLFSRFLGNLCIDIYFRIQSFHTFSTAHSTWISNLVSNITAVVMRLASIESVYIRFCICTVIELTKLTSAYTRFEKSSVGREYQCHISV